MRVLKDMGKVRLVIFLAALACLTILRSAAAQEAELFAEEATELRYAGSPDSGGIVQFVAALVNISLGLASLAATCQLILSGFKWKLSSGNQDIAVEAQQNLASTLAILIVILLVWAAARFVIGVQVQAAAYGGGF